MKRAVKIGEATINGKQVSFFSPPHDEPDFLWVDALELAKAFLPAAAAKRMVQHAQRFSKGPSAVATARNGLRVATIMCHAMAQGLTGAIDQLNGDGGDDDSWPEGGAAFSAYCIEAGKMGADNLPMSMDELKHAFHNPGGRFMRDMEI